MIFLQLFVGRIDINYNPIPPWDCGRILFSLFASPLPNVGGTPVHFTDIAFSEADTNRIAVYYM
jgi:hypothetical protein